jgi:hypothetical protein
MRKANKKQHWYAIGFLEHDGSFNVLSNRKLHNVFPSWEAANDKCKELQPQYKHHLEPHYV